MTTSASACARSRTARAWMLSTTPVAPRASLAAAGRWRGAIGGAGLLSHAPVIMFPQEQRIAVNGGRDYTLATGLTRLRADVFEQAEYDPVIVIDSHWTTTTEFVVTSHAK